MEYNSDFKYDLKVGQIKEIEFGKLFSNSKIEVKHDLKALETGNIYVEFESRGKPSGIAISEADYYCFAFGSSFHVIPSSKLKEITREVYKERGMKLGGDNNTSKGVLVPITKLLT